MNIDVARARDILGITCMVMTLIVRHCFGR